MQKQPEENPDFHIFKSLMESVTTNKHNKPNKPKHPPIRFCIPLVTALAFISLIGAGWVDHQTQPISDEQRIILSSLVAKAAKQQGVSTQKVWTAFHRRMDVTSVRHLKRWSYNSAVEYLSEKSAP